MWRETHREREGGRGRERERASEGGREIDRYRLRHTEKRQKKRSCYILYLNVLALLGCGLKVVSTNWTSDFCSG